MNDDVMRLPDLVKEWAICYEVDEQDVAHDLHELMKELYLEYGVRQGKLALPSHVFWVGRAGGPQPSVRTYKLFFEGMIECLELFSDPLSSAEKYSMNRPGFPRHSPSSGNSAFQTPLAIAA